MDDPDLKSPTNSAEEVLLDSESASEMLGTSRDAPNSSAESRKIGVAGAVFLILNKMIGTGSRASPLLT